MTQTAESTEVRSLQSLVQSVLEARRVKEEVRERHGGRSATYLDARDLVHSEEGRLLATVIKMFASGEVTE